MSLGTLNFDQFLKRFKSGSKYAVSELKLRVKIGDMISDLLGTSDLKLKESSTLERFFEFATLVEKSTGCTIGQTTSLVVGDYSPTWTSWTDKIKKKGGIRAPFIFAIWYWFHQQKLDSYAAEIDDEVLGQPLKLVFKEHDSFRKVKAHVQQQFPEETSGEKNVSSSEQQTPAVEPKPIFLPDPHNVSQIHSYVYSGEGKIRVLGRKKEQEKLQRFLKADQNYFLWLQVAGVAGQGKSRLGWELIQHARKELLWQAGFWAIPNDLEAKDDTDEFIAFWDNWLPDKPYLLVVDYVIALSPVLGPAIQSLIERSDAFKHPVRLLLLERQRWDRGGFVVNHGQDEPDELKSSLTNSLNRSAWFDDLNEAAAKRDLADPKHLFEKTGIVELTRLSSEDLVRITRDVFSIATAGAELLKSEADLKISLSKIDREGRPLYAYFLGQSIADGAYKASWNRDDLLKSVLNREQKKRWSLAFDGEPPALGSKEDALSIAILATICGGVAQEQLIDLPSGPEISGQVLDQSLALVNGPMERGVTGPAEVVPPLQPDILGEWFVLTALKLQGKQARDKLLCHAWKLSATGCARFLQRVAADFPELALQLELFRCPTKEQRQYEQFCYAAASISSALIATKAHVPQPVVQAIEKAVESGDAQAMNALGYLLSTGIGVKKNETAAFELYRQSASKGHAFGMYNYAISLLTGLGCETDPIGGIEELTRAAEKGFTSAKSHLGFHYMNGKGVEQNVAKAVAWWSESAEAGDATAMTNLGLCHKNGHGVEKDTNKAVVWWHKAAEAGSAIAMMNLGVCYKNGDGVEQDTTEAVTWWRKAAEAGDADAMRNLGLCYMGGDDVEQDTTEAVAWLRKAAEAGSATAMTNLGLCHKNGDGVEQDITEAVTWWRKATEAGDADAMRNLGLCYMDGDGVEQNAAKAVAWWSESAEAGDATAMTNLGLCHKNGHGVEKDTNKAVVWWHKAAEAGSAIAMMNLGVCYKNGDGVEQDTTEAVTWWRKAAEAGDADAMRNLGLCYMGGDDAEQDTTEAVAWLRKAAEAGSAIAMMNLGVCYMDGIGMEQELTEAVAWYQKAAKAGDATAMTNLGVCYMGGIGVEQDLTEAVAWYQKAAETGDATAMTNLGICYKNGDGVEQDTTEAVAWWHKAAEAGDATAMTNLGICYRNSIGVKQDLNEAMAWWRKAAQAGDATAMVYLGAC